MADKDVKTPIGLSHEYYNPPSKVMPGAEPKGQDAFARLPKASPTQQLLNVTEGMWLDAERELEQLRAEITSLRTAKEAAEARVASLCEEKAFLANDAIKERQRTEAAEARAAGLEEIAREFCRRVEAGEIRSKKTYAAFKAALSPEQPNAVERVIKAAKEYIETVEVLSSQTPDTMRTYAALKAQPHTIVKLRNALFALSGDTKP